MPVSGSAETQVIGAMLMGRATLFGKRIEILWPDGMPHGMTEAELRALGERWAPTMSQQWVPAGPVS